MDTGREVAIGAAEPVVIASVFKVPLLVAFHRQAADGLLDPAEQVVLRPQDRTAGPTGCPRCWTRCACRCATSPA